MKQIWIRNEGHFIQGIFLIFATLIPLIWSIFVPSSYISPGSFDQQPTSVNSNKNSDPFRRLEPLETGKYIGDLPDGIYGFAEPYWIQYEIKEAKPHWKSLKVGNQNFDGFFELQKHGGSGFLVGFVGSDTFARIGEVNDQNPTRLTLSPREWDSQIKSVGIPLDSIDLIDGRNINVGPDEVMLVFELEVRKIESVNYPHTQ